MAVAITSPSEGKKGPTASSIHTDPCLCDDHSCVRPYRLADFLDNQKGMIEQVRCDLMWGLKKAGTGRSGLTPQSTKSCHWVD
jgi:hypothetical protein